MGGFCQRWKDRILCFIWLREGRSKNPTLTYLENSWLPTASNWENIEMFSREQYPTPWLNQSFDSFRCFNQPWATEIEMKVGSRPLASQQVIQWTLIVSDGLWWFHHHHIHRNVIPGCFIFVFRSVLNLFKTFHGNIWYTDSYQQQNTMIRSDTTSQSKNNKSTSKYSLIHKSSLEFIW